METLGKTGTENLAETPVRIPLDIATLILNLNALEPVLNLFLEPFWTTKTS